MRTIAIDCGASFIKTAYFDNDVEVPQEVQSYATSSPGELELLDARDAELPIQLRRTVTMIRKALLGYSRPGEELQLGICNEMHGFVITDEEGKPITDYVSWQMEYSRERYSKNITWGEHYIEILDKQDITYTGMPLKPGLPSTNLPYILKHNKEQCCSGTIYFYTLGDFVIHWLANQQICMHPTNAAATGLYNLMNNNWNSNLLSSLGLEHVCFPVISDNAVITFVWRERTIYVKPAIGDQQAALRGADLCKKQQLSINMGTGGQVGRLTDTLLFSEQYQIRPYFNDMYLMTVPHIPSGRALNVYIRFVQQIAEEFAGHPISNDQIWKWIFREMECVDQDEGLMNIDLSFFANAITKNEKGSITGIEENSLKIGNLFQSIFLQMAKNIKECAQRINNGCVVEELVFSGGIVRRNNILREMIQAFYPQADIQIAANETLIGIYRYVRSDV